MKLLDSIIQLSHRKRCILFGCVYGIEHVDKEPLDECMFCGEPRPDMIDYWLGEENTMNLSEEINKLTKEQR